MRNLIACIAVVACVACYGGKPTYSQVLPPDAGGFTGGPPIVAGDGGVSDAGTDAGIGDAGCFEVLVPNLEVTDNCNASGAQAAPTIAVDTNTCAVTIDFASGSSPCTGAVSGVHDAFVGSCVGANSSCTAPSLPGVITCTGTAAPCTVRICQTDGGGC